MPKAYFVSDLHLFAGHSQAERHMEAIRRAASGAAILVLGGDIFDFRWTRTSTVEEAVRQAIEWLGRLSAECAECQFHYLLGNHDYHQMLIDRLAALELARGNLSWHPFHLRLGSSVFLHGDVARKKMDPAALAAARSRWLHAKKRGPALRGLYELAIRAGVHKPIPRLLYPKRTVARRLLAYLEHTGQGPQQGVRDVYFGHTHVGLSHYRYGALTFHNGGATIKGLDFRIVEAVVSE